MRRISIEDHVSQWGFFGAMGFFFFTISGVFFFFFVTGDVLFQWNILSAFVCIIFRFTFWFFVLAFVGLPSSAFHGNFLLSYLSLIVLIFQDFFYQF